MDNWRIDLNATPPEEFDRNEDGIFPNFNYNVEGTNFNLPSYNFNQDQYAESSNNWNQFGYQPFDPPMSSNYSDNLNSNYQMADQPLNYFQGCSSSSMIEQPNYSANFNPISGSYYGFCSEPNFTDLDQNTNLNLGGYLENTNHCSSSNTNLEYIPNPTPVTLPTVIENEENLEEEEEDIGPAELSSLATGEDYTDPSDFSSSDEEPELRRSNTTLLIRGRSEREHPVSDFNCVELFDRLGSGVGRMGPDDELAENRYFSTKEALQWVIFDWAIRKNVQLKVPTSNQSKLVMVCLEKERQSCPWRLYAKSEPESNSWRIITNKHPHICKRRPQDKNHVQLTASLIAGCVRQNLKQDLSLSVGQIKMLIDTRYPGVGVSYNKLWRGRERAIEQLFGSWEGSYSLLPQILAAIARTTPGTVFKIATHDTTDNNVKLFKCAAWAYGPCIEAFKYCRPVITIDGGFMSGRYQGRLLMACGYDAENKLIPLAFGLVEEENLDNWGWFMRFVRNNVIKCNKKICVISDRHKAIKAVFERQHLGWSEELGEAVHRYCMQHVAENLYKEAGKKGDSLKDDFKCRLANKKKPRRFTERWRILRKHNRKAYDFLKKVGKRLENDVNEPPKWERWAQTFDVGYRWGIMTSNGSEALNSIFKIERTLPVVAIVEGTWYKCAKWFDDRHMRAVHMQNSEKRFPVSIEDLLMKRGNKAARMTTFPLGTSRGEYEVQVTGERIESGGYGPFKYTVNISAETTREDPTLPQPGCSCECLKPQLTGLPCSHVIAVCQHRRFDVYDLVDKRYSVENLVNTWSGQFHSYGDQEVWPPYLGPKLIPNKDLINRGRRKHNRRTMVMDEMEGRRRGHGKSRTNRRNKERNVPLPMETLQSGRHTSRPTSPARNENAPRRDVGLERSTTSRHENAPRRDVGLQRSATSRHVLQPSRFSVDVPRDGNSSRTTQFQSARFSVDGHRDRSTTTRHDNRAASRSTGGRDEGRQNLGARILNYFSRRKKK